MFQEFQFAQGLVPDGACQLEGLAGEAHDRQLGISQPQIDDNSEWRLVKAQQKRGLSYGFLGQGAFLRRPSVPSRPLIPPEHHRGPPGASP